MPIQREKTPQQTIQELKDLVVAYFKQETLDPLRSLGRYVGFGIGGALVLAIGITFVSIGTLRVLQTETGDAFDGNWSWVPYAIVIVALLAVAGLTWYARGKRSARQ